MGESTSTHVQTGHAQGFASRHQRRSMRRRLPSSLRTQTDPGDRATSSGFPVTSTDTSIRPLPGSTRSMVSRHGVVAPVEADVAIYAVGAFFVLRHVSIRHEDPRRYFLRVVGAHPR
jgi:hypothetical protein